LQLAVGAEAAVGTIRLVDRPLDRLSSALDRAAGDENVDVRPDRSPGGGVDRQGCGHDPPVETWPVVDAVGVGAADG
jgi:hypothetical protein